MGPRGGILGGGRCRRGLTIAGLVTLAAIVTATAPPAGAAQTKGPGCRGVGELSGFFELGGKRKLALRETDCGTGRRLAKRFADRCLNAFAAQRMCRVRAGARWRCRTTMLGSSATGVKAREKCRRGSARVKFILAYSPPSEPTSFGAPVNARGPYREPPGCVDTSTVSTTVAPAPGASFELRVSGGVAPSAGASVQQTLVGRSVDQILTGGLGSAPRNAPARIPLYLTPRSFDQDGNLGIAPIICGNPALNGLIARTDGGEAATIAAHELFHAYSYWGIANGNVDAVPWWEEAAATWAEAKMGFPEVTRYDPLLQFPAPLDGRMPGAYPYAMSRFVQFLDDRGLVGAGNWALQREVIGGYPNANSNAGTTQGLAAALAARGTTLGEELAAFWGDRIRNRPAHGPQLMPGRNARLIEVKPGTDEISQPVDRLDTVFINFTLDDDVRRVEFEFDAPDGVFFWGAPTERTSRRYHDGESASFCVGGSDEDDLEWPIRFPVTVTNGRVADGALSGKITLRAQSDAEQCTGPGPNRACRLLQKANVSGILGPGSFPFASESSDGDLRYWLCFYHGNAGEVNFNLARFPNRTPRQVRQAVRQQIAGLGFRRIDVGDLAGIGVVPGEPNPAVGLVMAINREIAFLIVGPGTNEGPARQLARRIAE